jgi:hypothetical protein
MVSGCVVNFDVSDKPRHPKIIRRGDRRSLIIVSRVQGYVTVSAAADEASYLHSPADCF